VSEHSDEIGTQRANPEGNAVLARYHKANATPKAEFAALMSIAGYSSFAEACDVYDAAPVAIGEDFGRAVGAENGR
jgi:hypothetical protein